MSDNGSEIGVFMAGFVIGGLVGAATALILAPQSGVETRAQIAAKGDEVRRVSEQRIHDLGEKAGTATGQAQERARIVLDEGKHKVNTAFHKELTEEQLVETDSEDAEA
jgi:gas vesicle protein